MKKKAKIKATRTYTKKFINFDIRLRIDKINLILSNFFII